MSSGAGNYGASGHQRQAGNSSQEEADRLLAENLCKQWEEEDGLAGHHLDLKAFNFEDEFEQQDLQLAMKLHKQGDIEDGDINMTGSVIDPNLELVDPIPDLWHLFRCFDTRFFDRKLTSSGVELSWSPRMTSCAGLCGWSPRSGACFIRISKPLLELRPRKDLVETLIHEMIHALLFVKRIDDNHESHGQVFHQEMYRINQSGKCKITVYHTFHDEVRHFKNHVWRCQGVCRNQAPFFGWCRRSMNRAPGPSDTWHKRHQETCGGTFVKVSEPEKVKATKKKDTIAKSSEKKVAKPNEKKVATSSQDVRNFFHPQISGSHKPSTSSSSSDRCSGKAQAEVIELD